VPFNFEPNAFLAGRYPRCMFSRKPWGINLKQHFMEDT
jgi:hypothetical protein